MTWERAKLAEEDEEEEEEKGEEEEEEEKGEEEKVAGNEQTSQQTPQESGAAVWKTTQPKLAPLACDLAAGDRRASKLSHPPPAPESPESPEPATIWETPPRPWVPLACWAGRASYM